MKIAKKLTQLIRSRRNGEPRDRGAVLVEAAIAIPILLVVILGSVEMGFAWDAKSATVSGVRTGTLRAASLAGQPETDLRVLQSVIGEIGADNVDRLNHVIIFDASTGDNQQAIDDCVAGGGVCVLYDNTMSLFDDIVASTVTADRFDNGQNALFANGMDMPPTGYACDPSKTDTDAGPFCAGARTVTGDAEIGIAVSYSHEWFTGIFPFNAPQFNESTVTSTFLEDGADISPTNAIPSAIPSGTIIKNFTFGAGFDTTGIASTAGTAGTITPPLQPAGTSVLGPFSSGTVTIPIDTPAAVTQPVEICVSFTAWLIGSWDGLPEDSFGYDLDPGDGVVEGTPTGYDHQAGGGTNWVSDATAEDFGVGNNPDWDRAKKLEIMDVCVQNHQGATIDMAFIATLSHASINNESWAIDDLVETVG